MPEENFLPAKSLHCSRHNLVAIFNNYGEELKKGEKIGILTNVYHMPRVFKLWENLVKEEPAYYGISSPETFLAEEILGNGDALSFSDERYQLRLKEEEEGLTALQKGSYIDSCFKAENLPFFRRIIEEQGSLVLTPSEIEKFYPGLRGKIRHFLEERQLCLP